MEKYQDCPYKNTCTNLCEPTCIRYVEMLYLLQHSNIPKKLWTPAQLTPDVDDADSYGDLQMLKDNITSIVDNGENICIYSRYCHNGKTSWAIRLMLKYFDQVWDGNCLRTRGAFFHIPSLILAKDFTALKEAMSLDLVILDDAIPEEATPKDIQPVLQLLGRRSLEQKSTIITLNDTIDSLSTRYNERIVSRVVPYGAHQFEFYGGPVK